MSRPSFEDICARIALDLSKRSSCRRLSVGTVITTTDFRKILAWGYNGNACGLPNTCDSDTPGACGCLHSETNAIINCDSPRTVEKFVFITHSPCVMCSKSLINLGNVKKVFYLEEYRDKTGLNFLMQAGIEVVHYVLG